MAKIVAMLPGGRRKTFHLTQSTMILGRSETSDIPLPTEPKASRKHLQISHIAGVISVEDLQSANGTWFQGKRITTHKITDRDILTIGETRLQFLFDDKANPDPPRSRKKRGLATIETEQVIEFLPNGNWNALDEPVPYVEMLDGEARGLKIAFRTPITMGRGGSCEVVLEGKKVSNTHARFEMAGNQAFVKDLGSTNGTQINSFPLQPQIPKELQHGDIIEVGENRFVFRIPPELRVAGAGEAEAADGPGMDRMLIAKHSLIFVGGPRKGQRVNMAEKVTLGRHSYNTVSMEGGKVSNYHAEILVAGRQFWLRDLQSTNGTFLNGKPINPKKAVVLEHEDIINIGDHVLAFEEAGNILDLDGRVARIRAKSREKVAFAVLRGILVLAFALVLVLFLTDLIVKQIPPPPDPMARATKPMQSPTREMSFEFDPAQASTIPGWDLSSDGQTCNVVFDPNDMQGGNYSLWLQPSGGTIGQSRLRLRTREPLVRSGGTALRVGAWIKSDGFRENIGLVGLRAIWGVAPTGPASTIVWNDAAAFQKNEWTPIVGDVPIPDGVTHFHLELFVDGVVNNLWIDEVTVAGVAAERPAVRPEVRPLDDLAVEFDGPARLRVAAGSPRRPAVDRMEPVLLVRSTWAGEQRYLVFQRASQAGPIKVDPIGNRGRDLQYELYGPVSKQRQGMGLTITPEAESRTIKVARTLYGVKLHATETLALELRLNVGSMRDPNRLQVFNRDSVAITPPADFTGLLSNVAEIVWGDATGARELGIQLDPPGRVYLVGGDQPTAYIFVAEGDDAKKPQPILTLRPFAEMRREAASKLFTAARDLKRNQEQWGDALLLFQEGLRRYDGFLDFGRRFRQEIQELDGARSNFFQTIRGAVETLQVLEIRSVVDAQSAIGPISQGLRACDEYRRRFRALADELRQVEAWANFLHERHQFTRRLMEQSDRQTRIAQAQRLLAEAQRYACIGDFANLNSERNFQPYPLVSTVTARLYAEQVVNFYPDLTAQVSAAQRIIDFIERLWEGENRDETGPARTAIRNFDAADNRVYGEHERALGLALARYPNSPHRVDLLARFLWCQAEDAFSGVARAQTDAEKERRKHRAIVLFQEAIALLPEPERDPAANSPRQTLRLQIERRALNELRLDID